MLDADEAWRALGDPWRAAFREAWDSWCAGNFGIGAVLVDPASMEIVSAGRNRVLQREPDSRQVAGNMMAHAEMNAFAALPRWNADGLHLYTTLEPCVMCAATSIMLNVEHIHFAAADAFFADLDTMWRQHHYSAERLPAASGPVGGPLQSFARVLPLTFNILFNPGTAPIEREREIEPALVACAESVLEHGTLAVVKEEGGTALDALKALWPDLVRISPSDE